MAANQNMGTEQSANTADAYPYLTRVSRVMLCKARQCWEQAIAGIAMMELGNVEYLLAMCDDMITRQNGDGRLCDVESTPAATDPALCIRPLFAAYQKTGNESYHEAVLKNIDFLLHTAPRSTDGILYHLMDERVIWADSAAMTPAALVQFGHLDFGLRQMDGITTRLLRADGLYAHQWDDTTGSIYRMEAWGVGNGWIAVGLAWLMIELKKQNQDSAPYRKRYCNLLKTLNQYRMPNGLLHNIIDQQDSFTDCEAAAMVAYSEVLLYENGLMDQSALDDANTVFQTLTKHVDERGYVRECAGSPTFNQPGTSTEVQAFYLMLYAAIRRAERMQ